MIIKQEGVYLSQIVASLRKSLYSFLVANKVLRICLALQNSHLLVIRRDTLSHNLFHGVTDFILQLKQFLYFMHNVQFFVIRLCIPQLILKDVKVDVWRRNSVSLKKSDKSYFSLKIIKLLNEC